MIEVICGDSMRILPDLAEKMTPSFQMIFIDPPYFDWATGEPGAEKPDHNALSYLVQKLLKPSGCVFLCGTIPQLVKDWKYWGRFFNINFELIEYHKSGGTPLISVRRLLPVHENIWCLTSKRAAFPDIKIDVRKVAKSRGRLHRAKKKASAMAVRYGEEWVEWRTNVGYPKDVFMCDKIGKHSKEYSGHPDQKPLALMRMLIKMSTEPGDWVLDPFFGVGTTAIACDGLERNCLGVEINKEYLRLYRRRRDRIRIQQKLKKWTRTPST